MEKNRTDGSSLFILRRAQLGVLECERRGARQMAPNPNCDKAPRTKSKRIAYSPSRTPDWLGFQRANGKKATKSVTKINREKE